MSDRLGKASTFVVLGEGLAAGVGHFSLTEEIQPWSFPALVASQLGTLFHQPLMQAPGLGNAYDRQAPAIVPDLLQTTVRTDFPGAEHALNNFSVPGLTARDALKLRPRSPLVHRRDAKQTLVNFILGLPGLTEADGPRPTQLEAAQQRKPTLALVELGYYELLELCVKGYQHSGERMDLPDFEEDYDAILKGLAESKPTIVAATVPDPLHTAYFSTLPTAAKILRTEADFLRKQFDLQSDDRISVPGLIDIGFQLTARQITGTIEEGGVLSGAEAARISQAVARVNAAIRRAAAKHSALVYDLAGFLLRLALDGAKVGSRRLTHTFLDGLYLLNGVYPGRTGHALIANDLLIFLNRELGVLVEPVNIDAILEEDSNALAQLSSGEPATDQFLVPRTPADIPRMPPPDPSMINVFPPFDPTKFNLFPIQTIYPELDPSGKKLPCEPAKGIPAGGM